MTGWQKLPKKEKSDVEILLEWCRWKKERLQPLADDVADSDRALIRAIENVCSQLGTWRSKFLEIAKHDMARLAFDALNLLAASGISLTTQRGQELFEFVNRGLERAKAAMPKYELPKKETPNDP